jgi:hypothetical protein
MMQGRGRCVKLMVAVDEASSSGNRCHVGARAFLYTSEVVIDGTSGKVIGRRRVSSIVA